MKKPFESKIKNLPGVYDLDTYYAESGSQPRHPAKDFVISRKVDGSVLSRYGDEVWDLTPYNSASGKVRLYFKHPSGEEMTEDVKGELKWVTFCLLYLIPSPLSANSVVGFFNALKNLAAYHAIQKSRSFLDYIGDFKSFNIYIRDVKPSNKQIISLVQVIFHLLKVGSEISGINVNDSLKFERLGSELQNVRTNQVAQTLPIPSRVYLQRMMQLESVLDEVMIHCDQIVSLLRKCLQENHYGLSYDVQRCQGRGKSERLSSITGQKLLPFQPDFDEALREHGLTEFAKKFEFRSRQTLSGFISKIRYVCKHQLHLYSGMRHDEVKLLKVGSLVREPMIWGDAWFLEGVTTKVHKGSKKVRWVTSSAVESAIKIAEAFTREIARYWKYEPEDCSLFLPLSNLQNQTFIPAPDDTIEFELSRFNPESIVVTKDDLLEIERIVLDVDWEKYPDVKIGEPWPFKPHQYRRSLAVYGSNSGLIENTSMKFQLKHLTDSMTLYYAKGTERAIDILGDCDDSHFVYEYQKQKPVTDAIVFVRDYLLSDEHLFGGVGFLLHKADPASGFKIIKELREKTKRRFSKGEIAYKETPLGACMNSGRCDSRMQLTFTSCVTCPNAVLKPSKVSRYIEELESGLKQLAPNSLEYRLDMAQVTDMKRLQARMIAMSTGAKC